jgi:hypothetical protein
MDRITAAAAYMPIGDCSRSSVRSAPGLVLFCFSMRASYLYLLELNGTPNNASNAFNSLLVMVQASAASLKV